jgi:hypothetical protein
VSGGPPGESGAPPKSQSVYQSGGSTGLIRSAAGWSGQGAGQTNLGHFWQAIPPSFFLCIKTPSPVNLNLKAYISNISSHKT